MDPQGQYLVEALLRALEVVVAKERERTRLMKKRLRAGQAKLKAKEGELSMLRTEKDRVLALKEVGETLVADFLEADGKKNFADQKAMINIGGSDGGKGAGFDGVYGRGINYLENSQNLDEKAMIATVKRTNSDGNGSSRGGGSGGGGKGGGFEGVDGGGINDLENAQNLDEEAVIATVKGTNSDGNGSNHGCGGSGGFGV